MDKALDRAAALATAEPFIDCGCAVHWLRPRDKMPVAREWSTAPVHTSETLIAEYRDGANLGIRLGEPSKTPGGHLHIIDLDIRKPELAPEAWAALLAIWPEAGSFPMVISGSGGESRHIHLICDKPFAGRKLAVSDGFEMVLDPRKGREVKKRDWEIDFLGTGRQAVLPPSIHPDTGEAYSWEGPPPDLDLLDMGIGPLVDSALVESWGLQSDDDDEDDDHGVDDDEDAGAALDRLVSKARLGLSLEEIEGHLRKLPEEWVEDRDLWLNAGMAVHHETKGSVEGFDIWCEWSEHSGKFDEKDARRVWRSFKDRTRNPCRMPTIIQAAGRSSFAASFAEDDERDAEDFPDLPDDDDEIDLSDILGPTPGGAVATTDAADLSNILSESMASSEVARTESAGEWVNRLALIKDGTLPTAILPNIRLIIANDPRTRGIIAFNEFTNTQVLVKEPGVRRLKTPGPNDVWQLSSPIWRVPDKLLGAELNDDHSGEIRNMIEAPERQGGYGIQVSDRNIFTAISGVAMEHSYHPVREMLNRMAWDGIPRVDHLFVDFLGCTDDAYHRQMARLMLLGAVTRIFEPGHKFDFVPILEGGQGIGKSSFIEGLALGWKSDLSGEFHDDKRMVEQMQGSWIIEIPELQGFSKAEITTLKAFITRGSDKVRLSYERKTRIFPRQSVFVGSTNEKEYLRDDKNRRYLPVKCAERQIDIARLEDTIPLIWAEAVHIYREMRARQERGRLPLYPTGEVKRMAEAIQEDRRVIPEDERMAGEIAEWLDQPVDPAPEFDELEDSPVREVRSRTCAKEIIEKMYDRPKGSSDHRFSTLVGKALARLKGWEKGGYVRVKDYGQQQVYVRTAPPSED